MADERKPWVVLLSSGAIGSGYTQGQLKQLHDLVERQLGACSGGCAGCGGATSAVPFGGGGHARSGTPEGGSGRCVLGWRIRAVFCAVVAVAIFVECAVGGGAIGGGGGRC